MSWRQVDRKLVITVALIVVVLDQCSKLMVLRYIQAGELFEVIPNFFNLTLVFNPGAAFGMLGDLPDPWRAIVLSSLTVLALLAVSYFLFFEYYHDRIAQGALAMIVGGAAGNIIDRVRLGEVVDFLDFYIQSYHWHTFNIADSAICLGVALLLFRRPAPRAEEIEA